MQSCSAAPRALKGRAERAGAPCCRYRGILRPAPAYRLYRVPSSARFCAFGAARRCPQVKCGTAVDTLTPRCGDLGFISPPLRVAPSYPRPGIGSYSVICSFISMPSRHLGVLLIGQYETLTSSSEGISHILSGSEVSLVR